MARVLNLMIIALLALSMSCRTVTTSLPNVSRAGTYTNLHFDEATGRVSGMEIHVTPIGDGAEYQATVQIAAEKVGPVVVVPVTLGFGPGCQTLTLDVAEPYSIRIVGCLYLEQLSATVTHPDGSRETTVLPRTSSYWDRNGA